MPRGELTPIDKEYKKIISNNLHNIARQKGLKQIDIVKISHLSASTLNGYFKGTRLPSKNNLLKLSSALQVSPSDIDPRYEDTPANPEITDSDLNDALDNTHSFDGHPLDDNDRKIIKGLLKGYFDNKN